MDYKVINIGARFRNIYSGQLCMVTKIEEDKLVIKNLTLGINQWEDAATFLNSWSPMAIPQAEDEVVIRENKCATEGVVSDKPVIHDTLSKVDHPRHYSSGSIECIDAMESAFGKEKVISFCHLNAFKYIWRSQHKDGNTDIEKAIWYLQKELSLKQK